MRGDVEPVLDRRGRRAPPGLRLAGVRHRGSCAACQRAGARHSSRRCRVADAEARASARRSFRAARCRTRCAASRPRPSTRGRPRLAGAGSPSSGCRRRSRAPGCDRPPSCRGSSPAGPYSSLIAEREVVGRVEQVELVAVPERVEAVGLRLRAGDGHELVLRRVPDQERDVAHGRRACGSCSNCAPPVGSDGGTQMPRPGGPTVGCALRTGPGTASRTCRCRSRPSSSRRRRSIPGRACTARPRRPTPRTCRRRHSRSTSRRGRGPPE